MYYVHGIGPKSDQHVNFPAHNAQAAYDLFKQEMGPKTTVVAIVPLFSFEYTPEGEEKRLVTN
jgi:hypothetical protein